jgi:hypothetical protein
MAVKTYMKALNGKSTSNITLMETKNLNVMGFICCKGACTM